MYARYRTRSKFYKRREPALRAYGVAPDLLRRPRVKPGLLSGVYTDEKVDLRDQQRLELLESIRHPKERDFYQDHTYYNQWVQRDLEKHQKAQIKSRYRFMAPDYVIQPWIWYPGDMVEVTDGESAGQRGSIIAVIKYKNEIVVQNVNVQDVTIPATETRPEQIVQREHPISVHKVRHVDPSTGHLCHLELVKVRNKETGAVEEKRISLQSGVLLPIPEAEAQIEVGDPLRDTPIQDADEPTFDAASEMPVLVERRLRAMEDHFIGQLKKAYEFHHPLSVANGVAMQQYQQAVVGSASAKLAASNADSLLGLRAAAGVEAGRESLPDWWKSMMAPYMEWAEEELERQREEAEAAAAAQRPAEEGSTTPADGDDDGYEDEEDVEDGVEEEEEEENAAEAGHRAPPRR